MTVQSNDVPHGGPTVEELKSEVTPTVARLIGVGVEKKEPWNNAEMLRWKMKWTRETIRSELPMLAARIRLWKSYREGMPDPTAKALVNQVIFDMEQLQVDMIDLQLFAIKKESDV